MTIYVSSFGIAAHYLYTVAYNVLIGRRTFNQIHTVPLAAGDSRKTLSIDRIFSLCMVLGFLQFRSILNSVGP